ncbi:MFS transporter [Chitinophaga sp. Cy-1792]|uniref:MFS transporter n=1 Tax=Chitinophaga sp. Cy-1792 TaxID=2608339 RepID=UPI0014218C1C|nr:MFS transporter [Chitinophaga sp. Cy-1792]NIG53307.1 MFS transporter [Chitinophaga sp. Cy-1792]
MQQRIILTIACLAVFFETLDASVLNMAIPSMEGYFRFSADAIQWVQTVYILFYGGFVLLGGRLADIKGRRNIYMVGAGLFGLASFACGCAQTFSWLLAFRALQGIGVAFAIPAAIAIIINTFPEPAARNRAMGIFGAMAGTGFAAGLATGGLITSYWGWQWVFFINVPVIMLAVFFAWKFIPADKKEKQQHKEDLSGGLILTVLMLAAAWIIHSLGSITTAPVQFAATVAGFLLLGFYFVRKEQSHTSPLIDFKLLRLPGAVTGNLGALLTGAAFGSYLFLLTLYLQQHLLLNPAQAGMLLLPFSIMSGLFSKFLLPLLFRRIGVISVGVIGNIFMVSGFILFIISYLGVLPLPVIVAAIFCTNTVGISMIFPSMTILGVESAPPSQQGLASGINGTANSFGGGLGLSLTGLVMQQAVVMQYDMHIAALSVLIGIEIIAIIQISRYQRKTKRQLSL